MILVACFTQLYVEVKLVATLAEQRTTLITRIVSLQSRITHGDKTVEYDLSMAQTALNILDVEIAKAGTPRTRNIRVKTSKGICA